MKAPFIFLCAEITRENALTLMRWLEDEEVTRYMRDGGDVSLHMAQVLEKVNLPVLTHLFNRNGKFYMAYDKRHVPVGFVRLAIRSAETEMVVAIGDKKNWGMRLGTSVIRESLKIAFFELRSPRVVAVVHKENRRSIGAFTGAGFRIEHETPALQRFVLTMEEYLKSIEGGAAMTSEIYITELDKMKLKKLIEEKSEYGMKPDRSLIDLDREIGRARVVDSEQLPRNVVSMHSRALLHLNGEDVDASLVYPDEADWEQNRISVLSPIGTAILGYREGDAIQWEIPSGSTVIKIKKILYQPEAAGDYHL